MTDIDAFDRRLLAAVQHNGAATTAELSEIAHLSPSQCSRRLQRLAAAGVIARRAAILDPAALGLGVTAFVQVSLQSHSDAQIAAFRERVLALRRCWSAPRSPARRTMCSRS